MVSKTFLRKQFSAFKQNSPGQFKTYMNDRVLPIEHGGMVLASDGNIYEFEFDDKGNAYSPNNIPKYDYYGGYSFIGHVDDFSPAKDIIMSDIQNAARGKPTLTGSAIDAWRLNQSPRPSPTVKVSKRSKTPLREIKTPKTRNPLSSIANLNTKSKRTTAKNKSKSKLDINNVENISIEELEESLKGQNVYGY